MSTKIYEGFMLEGIDSIADLNQWLEEARESFEQTRFSVVSGVLKRLATTVHVALHLSQNAKEFETALSMEDRPDSLVKEIVKEGRNIDRALKFYIIEAINKKDEERGLLGEILNYSMQLIFTKDGKVLGYPYGARRATAFDDWLKSRPGYKFYGYWNNVDPDEECSEEEWEQREKHWDEAVGYNPIGEYGLLFQPVIQWLDFMDVVKAFEEIEVYWGEHKKEFIAKHVKHRLVGQEMDRLMTEEIESDLKDAKFGKYMKLRDEVLGLLRDKDSELHANYQKELKEAMSSVPELTSEALHGKANPAWGE